MKFTTQQPGMTGTESNFFTSAPSPTNLRSNDKVKKLKQPNIPLSIPIHDNDSFGPLGQSSRPQTSKILSKQKH